MLPIEKLTKTVRAAAVSGITDEKRANIKKAWKFGTALNSLRDASSYGAFKPWLKRHNIGYSSAQRYMQFAKNYTLDEALEYPSVMAAIAAYREKS